MHLLHLNYDIMLVKSSSPMDSPDKVPFFMPFILLMKEANNTLRPTDSPGPFSLSDEENLPKDLFFSSMFEDVSTGIQVMVFNFQLVWVFTNFIYERASTVQAVISNQSIYHKKE